MAKLYANPIYGTEEATETTAPYLLDCEDGSEPAGCKIWIEKSKTTKTHPDGRPHILLPKDNPTNRRYVSLDAFNASAVDGVMTIEVKTTAPRVLGATGVRQDVIKYLNEEQAARYTELVNGAVEKYKAAKGQGKKKMEDMTEEELVALIDHLKNGTPLPAASAPKSFIDMFNEAEYEEYNSLLAISQENKANTPKAKRGPLSDAEKAARAEKRKAKDISSAEALLAALRAGGTTSVETSDDEDVDVEVDEDDIGYDEIGEDDE